MKVLVSKLRYCNVLPAASIERLSKMKLTGIKFLPAFYEKTRKWWEAERFIELTFNEPCPETEEEKIAKTCGACGQCCTDIPTHQIGIYMSNVEAERAEKMFPDKKIFQGHIEVEHKWFGVVDVKDNGDCVMLGPAGCTLGDKKPLWCKIYHCEKYQGQDYLFEKGKK